MKKPMWTLVALFALWILSMHYFLPMPVVVILFAALVSGTTVTICFAITKRKVRVETGAVAQRDANPEFLKKSA
jgi:hypothetical protein